MFHIEFGQRTSHFAMLENVRVFLELYHTARVKIPYSAGANDHPLTASFKMRKDNNQHRKLPSRNPVSDDSEGMFFAFIIATSLSLLAMVCGIAFAVA